MSELLSQIKGSVVVLRDRNLRELGNLINLIKLINLGWIMIKCKRQVCEQGGCSIDLLGFWYLDESS